MKNRRLALIALAGLSLFPMARTASASSSSPREMAFGEKIRRMTDEYVGAVQVKEIQVKDIVIPPAPSVTGRAIEPAKNQADQGGSLAASTAGALKASSKTLKLRS